MFASVWKCTRNFMGRDVNQMQISKPSDLKFKERETDVCTPAVRTIMRSNLWVTSNCPFYFIYKWVRDIQRLVKATFLGWWAAVTLGICFKSSHLNGLHYGILVLVILFQRANMIRGLKYEPSEDLWPFHHDKSVQGQLASDRKAL